MACLDGTFVPSTKVPSGQEEVSLRKERRPSRTREHARLLEAASRIRVPQRTDVCIVGGGAAGLVAAIVAAENGSRVVTLDADLECGRKILATGNGRCNFTNVGLDSARYNQPEFVRNVVGQSWLGDVLAFFHDCGLAWEEEAEGRLYPLSRQAASVRSVLLGRATRAGVILAPARSVRSVRQADGGFEVAYEEAFGAQTRRVLQSRTVVMAVGGGTDLCENIGLPMTPYVPVLCPLACEGPLLAELDGRRVRVEARLIRAGAEVLSERGEVLFRRYGLSGIVVFNLSRYARPGDELVLDLLPTMKLAEAHELGLHTLDGLLDPVIAQALTKLEGSWEGALTRAKALAYRIIGPADTAHAQVSRGGLDVRTFDSATLEAQSKPGLFACGEALDVDGPCGGFNLAWAWKSGMVAGAAAAKETSR